MAKLPEEVRRLKVRRGERTLPFLILMTDPVRLPDPSPTLARLPRGSAVILRHYDDPRREALGKTLREACRRCGLRLLVGNDVKLAHALKADGVHLSERRLRAVNRDWCRHRRPDWIITAAVHGPSAIRFAVRLNVDAVVLSPVFATKSHPGARALGPLHFARFARHCPLPVYALGGINSETARRLRGTRVAGFAGISGLTTLQSQRSRE